MNVIILGPQGSGKGTQAEKLAKKFNLEHIDMGKFLREAAKMDTELGREINEIVNIKKELVSDKILKKILHIKLQELSRGMGVIFDGVPRNKEQAEYFDAALLETGRKIDYVVLVKLSEEESIKRIAKRRICEKCKKTYIFGQDIKKEDEKCPQCGGKIIQRIDDTEEGVKKRLKIFQEETKPIIDFYKNQGKLIEINGDQEIGKVFNSIVGELRKSA